MEKQQIKFEIPHEEIKNKVQKLGLLSRNDYITRYFAGLQYENKWKLTNNGLEFSFNEQIFVPNEYDGKEFLVSPNKMFVLQKIKDEYVFIPQK